jgi:DNA-binding transcriptional LysR family regulator
MKADWDHLKVALAISRGGSLTAAATLLAMDQTTVGRRLNVLEDDLGTPLFIRSKSGFSATEAGQIVIENALRVEARLGQMRETLDDMNKGPAGVLRLAGNNWMLQRIAEFMLPEFLVQHPRIEMRLSGRLPPGPLFSEPTVSLWFDASPQAPNRATPLCSMEYAAYQSKNVTSDSETWVQFQDDVAQGPSFARSLRKRLGSTAQVRLTATDAQILQGAIRAGVARGVLPRCIGDHDPGLERVPDTDVIHRVLHFHASEDARRLKRVELFHKQLIEALRPLFEGSPIEPTKR